MAKDREGSVNIYGAMQAKTAQGIVAYTDGIAHENEDGTVINLDVMLKNGVGGGSAIVDVEELIYPGWKGTSFVNGETLENLYFNTNLSTEETTEIIKNSNYKESEYSNGVYLTYFFQVNEESGNEDLINSYVLAKVKYGSDYVYLIGNLICLLAFSTGSFDSNAKILFSSQDVSDFGIVSGWNKSISNSININKKLIIGEYSIDTPSIMSSTQIEYFEPNLKDDVFYRVEVSTQVIWSGTTVPNSGYVEKVYFNTNLTYDEVENIFISLNLEDGNVIPILSDSSSNFTIMIGKLEGLGYAIQGVDIKNDSEPLYWVSETIASLYGINPGWQTFDNPIEINLQVISEVDGMLVDKNDKISQLFSITPFEYTEGKPKYELYTYKNGEYKKVLQYGDISQESKEIDKTIVLTDISELGQIEYGSYSLTLTSEEFFQLITLEKNSINVIFDVSSIESFASQGINFLYTKVYFQSVSIEGLRLYGINNYKKTYNFLFTSSSLTSTGSTDGVSTVYDLTLEANGVRVYSKDESGNSTNKILSFSPPIAGGIQLISNGQVYTALQSYAKTEEVNQMIADYITTNFENGDEGSY